MNDPNVVRRVEGSVVEKVGDQSQGVAEEKSGLITVKALLIGSLLSFFLSVGDPYSNMVIKGSWMGLDFSTPGALFLFFFLVAILNAVLKYSSKSPAFAFFLAVVIGLPYVYRVLFRPTDFATPGMIFSTCMFAIVLLNLFFIIMGRSLALNRNELIVVYIMLICVSALSSMGLSEQLLPIMAGVFYYATPENKWVETLHPYIQQWMVPRDPTAIKDFFEGMPEGGSIPWGVWIKPLMYWVVLLAALYIVMVCLSVILRKQWMERERLAYPMAQVPLMIAQGESPDSLINAFCKNKIMWIGFAIPFIIGSIKGLHAYYPFVPTLNLAASLQVFRRTQSLAFIMSFPMIGFSYLINSDVAAGIWFFHILAKFQKGILSILGVTVKQTMNFGVLDSPLLAYQGIGAMIVMVVFGVWIGREYFKNVLLRAFTRRHSIDDSSEIISYRTAVFGAIIGLVVMALWLWASGMPLWVTFFFLFVTFLIFVGMTRVVGEGGVAVAVGPTIGSIFTVNAVGSSVLGPAGLISVAFTYVWSSDIRVFLMASCTNGLKLTEGMRRKNLRYIFWAIFLAILIGGIGSIWMVMRLAYVHGGINLSGWFFGDAGVPVVPFKFIVDYMTPKGPYWIGWISMGIGAGLMWLLVFVRQRFLWWPLNPLGFPIGATWIMDQVWFSVFIAWMIKVTVLKYGGVRLYQRLRPFFLGLILGQFVVSGIWLVIDYFTNMVGNTIFWI